MKLRCPIKRYTFVIKSPQQSNFSFNIIHVYIYGIFAFVLELPEIYIHTDTEQECIIGKSKQIHLVYSVHQGNDARTNGETAYRKHTAAAHMRI
jgi:hypothetical protein